MTVNRVHTACFPYRDGWGPLFESVSETQLAAAYGALAKGSHLDVEPHIAAYSFLDAGSRGSERPSSLVARSLRKVVDGVQPRLIDRSEFQRAVKNAAVSLLALHGPRGSLAFPVPHGVKSNLWVFLLLMRAMRRLSGKQWESRRSTIWLVVVPHYARSDGPKAHKRPPRPVRLVLCDDCVYSGQQMGGLLRSSVGALRPDAVTLCPMYATPTGLRMIMEQAPDTDVSLSVPGGMLGYSSRAVRKLPRQDLAFCIEAAPHRWVVVSLLSCMGILTHDIAIAIAEQTPTCAGPDLDSEGVLREWYRGARLRASSRVVGHTATVFQHKLADSLSVPTAWLLTGPTLRRVLTAACAHGPCSLSATVRLAVVRLPALLRRLDDALLRLVTTKQQARGKALQWMRGPHGFSCGSSILSARDVDQLVLEDKARWAPRPVRFDRMPMFVPLLQPPGACGPSFMQAVQFADTPDGDAWNAERVDMAQFAPESPAFLATPCINPPYKTVLRRKLHALLSSDRNADLARALLVE
jgi:hypothetical protein